MTENILEFPDRRAIEAEAAAWLIKLDRDREPSHEEKLALGAWLSRSPVHREELRCLAELWGNMNVLTELAVPLAKSPSHPDRGLLANFCSSIFGQRQRTITAALSVVVVALALVFWTQRVSFDDSNGIYSTNVGEQVSIALVDGSAVMLNTNSVVSVEYGHEYRDIRLLRGEAYFTVAKNEKAPFRVYAGTGRVQAVGTAFTVHLKDGIVDVTVTEGKVALATVNRLNTKQSRRVNIERAASQMSQANAITDDVFVETLGTVVAGSNATIRSIEDEMTGNTLNSVETSQAPEIAKRLSWRSGMLSFTGDTLEQVVDEISRYTVISIEVDPAIRQTRVGGQFPVGEIDIMFEYLETNFKVRVQYLDNNRVLLSGLSE